MIFDLSPLYGFKKPNPMDVVKIDTTQGEPMSFVTRYIMQFEIKGIEHIVNVIEQTEAPRSRRFVIQTFGSNGEQLDIGYQPTFKEAMQYARALRPADEPAVVLQPKAEEDPMNALERRFKIVSNNDYSPYQITDLDTEALIGPRFEDKEDAIIWRYAFLRGIEYRTKYMS